MTIEAEERRAAREAECRGDFAAADRVRATSFGTFTALVAERLEQGRRQYGDRSFTRPPAELASEIEEELADVCGWAYVLWCRVRRLKARLDTDPQKMNVG